MKVFVKGSNESGQLNDVISKGETCKKLIEMKLNFKIKQIACGYSHVLILTEDNELYGCGANKVGELGLKNIENVTNFTKIDTSNLDGEIELIQCQGYGSVLLTKNNNIYTAGSKLKEFTKIEINFGKIKLLRCGAGTIIVMNESGEFYMCGSNFGLLPVDDFTIPTFQQFYVNPDIIDFKIGCELLIMLDKFGKLFYIGYIEEKLAHWPTSFKVSQIACGYACFVVLNEKNELYFSKEPEEELNTLDKKLGKIELENNIQVKKLFSGLTDDIYFTTTDGKVYEFSCENETINQISFDQQPFSERFIYPITGGNFLYVITSDTPLFEDKSE